MKSERITFLATPEFKANLTQLAVRENTSVGEVIRGRFERAQNRPDASRKASCARLWPICARQPPRRRPA